MKNNILEIKGLEKTFESKAECLTVLKDLDFFVEEGTKNVITGESGCGKSTLLNIIAGIDRGTKGQILFNNQDLAAFSENQMSAYRSKSIGLVFQFHHLLKDFTALENVCLPAMILGVSKKEASEKAEKLLKDAGVWERRDHLPSKLSGGERQRVAVARALINDPALVLADEPTGNLDPENAAIIGDLLFSMSDLYKKTLILVTHDRSLATKGDYCWTIKEGKLCQV
ncbi:MAG: ABC transporter ATP-binding protein [Treponema sp.]|nr:ABC transporter ATP-binding protein [Treponema sp.]